MSNSDFQLPFPDRYLACANALEVLDHWLIVVGLSGNESFKRLQADFIKHGAATFRDISRNQPSKPLTKEQAEELTRRAT